MEENIQRLVKQDIILKVSMGQSTFVAAVIDILASFYSIGMDTEKQEDVLMVLVEELVTKQLQCVDVEIFISLNEVEARKKFMATKLTELSIHTMKQVIKKLDDKNKKP